MNLFQSKEDHVICISKLVFVTNFLDNFGSRDLWSLCEEYGKVVDVFILNRKSKAGKRFAFVRFIRVDDMDRLIGNLFTLWVGRLHLQANAVRYERPPKSSPSVKLPSVKSYAPFTSSLSGSFANVVKDIKNVPPHSTKDVNSILNLRTILTNEGFMDVKLSYLGGLWVMIELNSEETKMKLLQHTGVNSWYEELKLASQEFVCNERIVWVDIEGIPLHLCMAVNILETFKVIYKGKVFMVCAKELFMLSPCFLEYKDPGYLSEDESSLDGNNNLDNSKQGNVNQVEESDVDEANSHHSDDLFGLYDLLRKSTNLSASKEDPSLSHPPGFTPVASHQDLIHSNSAHLEVNQDEPPIAKGSSSKSYPKASCFSQASHGNDSSADSSTHVSSRSTPKGGSILEVLDGMIKVGRSMGYDMEGCSKDIEKIIRLQGEADAIRGVFVNGDWYTDPSMVKEAFLDHFAARFKQPSCGRLKLNMSFPNRLSSDQVGDLDKDISIDEISKSVWDCAINCFFDKGRFSRGSNSSFIALIPKCKRRRKQALGFKVDFAKAYDSVWWDFLLDVLLAFGFGPKWCQWIRGIFSSNIASILINKSPSSEFPIFSGLKQDDAVFIGEWSIENLDNLLKILNCFHLASGLCINVNKSHVLGVGVPLDIVHQGDGLNIRFWFDTWILDLPLNVQFPRLFALELDKDISVDVKWSAPSFDASFRRQVRDDVERNQWSALLHMLGTITLSLSPDRYFCDLNGEGAYRVKDIRSELDDLFLPSSAVATRWVNLVPIKVNIFAWRVSLDRLMTRGNLISKGVTLDSPLCPICELSHEDSSHLFFSYELGKSISQRIYRWWNIQWEELMRYF
nr:RNA-directed DNA polymerase, eukaryota, nucleotide-binding alpha-beta plait domain protein [Tanacetum cinerariifolium]